MSKMKVTAPQNTANDSDESLNTTPQDTENDNVVQEGAPQDKAPEVASSGLSDVDENIIEDGDSPADLINVRVTEAADDPDEFTSEDSSDDDEKTLVAKLERDWGKGCIKKIFNDNNWFRGQCERPGKWHYYEADLAKWDSEVQQAILTLSHLTKNKLDWVRDELQDLWVRRFKIRIRNGVKITIGADWAQKEKNILVDINIAITKRRAEIAQERARRRGAADNGGQAPDVGGAQQAAAEPEELGRTRGATKAIADAKDAANEAVQADGKKSKAKGKGKGKQVDDAMAVQTSDRGRAAAQNFTRKGPAKTKRKGRRHVHFDEDDGEQIGTQDDIIQDDEDEPIAGPSRNAPRLRQGQHAHSHRSQPSTASRPAASDSRLRAAEKRLEDAQSRLRLTELNIRFARTNRVQAGQEIAPYNEVVEAEQGVLEAQWAFEEQRRRVTLRHRELEAVEKELEEDGEDDEMEE